jgi:hypothetical protein
MEDCPWDYDWNNHSLSIETTFVTEMETFDQEKDRTVNGTFASISPVGTSRTVGFGSLLRASHGLTQRFPTA